MMRNPNTTSTQATRAGWTKPELIELESDTSNIEVSTGPSSDGFVADSTS
ncbi:MAG: hypothetical protein AAGK02_16035 [Pseudomonadota bacterium]